MAKKKKFYVVWQGHDPGIYDSWAACQVQIKGYPNAKYKSFSSKAEAEAAFEAGYDASLASASGSTKSKPSFISPDTHPEIIWDSISVDAACSGNPGIMEYQGVHTQDKSQIFYQKFQLGTNNIGEFLAIVHALALYHKTDPNRSIYTDSKTAMGWVARKKCNTKLERSAKTAKLYQVITRAESWLKSNRYSNPILKWDTDNWGEIPADFGRK